MWRKWATAILVLLTGAVCQAGQAQEHNPKELDLREKVSILRHDFEELKAQQRQILNELNELKQLLAANAARPNGQPVLPTTLSIDNEPTLGHNTARMAIIEFGDYECPYCGKFEAEVYPKIAENYITTGKVRYYFCDLPLPMHPHAMPAARAARCAGEQDKYWEMHDSLFARQVSLTNASFFERAQALGLDAAKFQECLASTRYLDEIRASIAEAQKMGITGTPTFLIGTIEPDGRTVKIVKSIRGAQPYEAFKAALDGLLDTAEPAR